MVRARCVNKGVLAPAVGQGDAVLGSNGSTPVARNNQVVAATDRHNSRHRRSGVRNANAGVVIRPDIDIAYSRGMIRDKY